MFFFDIWQIIFVAPAILLAMWAQGRVKSAYSRGLQVPARMSGAAAARYILDSEGLQDVGIEETHGTLSDHYDPRSRVLRLSHEVYHGHTAASVGIAAHEAGHAFQHAQSYGPLVVRNMAVPAAQFGPMAGMIMLMIGLFIGNMGLAWVGVAFFGAAVFFQLVNLPVEFDASNRAKYILAETGIVDGEGSDAVRDVLNAAGWTYVAATLHSVLQLAYFVFIILGRGGSDD